MKHLFYPLSLGLLALSACTSTEMIDESVQANAIGFETTLGRPTRADKEAVVGDLTLEKFDDFFVYGYYNLKNQTANPIQVFDGTPVSRNLDEPNPAWTYSNKRYWVPDAKYYFYAYTCADIELINDFGTPTLDLINDPTRRMKITSYICDNYHNHDLVYAMSEGIVGKAPLSQAEGEDKTYANDPVKFTFNHILTKIDAEFISDFDDGYNVEVADVKVVNIRNVGDYNPSLGGEYSWENQNRLKTHIVSPQNQTMVILAVDPNNKIANKGNTTVKTGSSYVIPYNYQAGDVQLQFTIIVTDKDTKEIVLSRTLTGSWSPNWKRGYYYTYKIRITGSAANLEEIRFGDMNVIDWGSKDGETNSEVSINFAVQIPDSQSSPDQGNNQPGLM